MRDFAVVQTDKYAGKLKHWVEKFFSTPTSERARKVSLAANVERYVFLPYTFERISIVHDAGAKTKMFYRFKFIYFLI